MNATENIRLIEGTDLTIAAKNIRTELRAAFPGVTFSVKTKRFSGGDSIDIYWTDGPTTAQVNAIADKYQDGDFDGMTDSYNYRRGDNWTQKHGGAKYVMASRSYSDELVAQSIAALVAKYGDFNTPTVEQYNNGVAWNVSPLGGDRVEHHWCWQSMITRQCAETSCTIQDGGAA